MSEAKQRGSTPRDQAKPSHRSILVNAPKAGAALTSLLVAPSAALAGETKVAQCYDDYLAAKNAIDAYQKASEEAHQRCRELSSEPPSEILQPCEGLRHSHTFRAYYASSPPGLVQKDDPRQSRAYYRSAELKKLLNNAAIPAPVRETANAILPIVESFEAQETRADELSGYAAFTDETFNPVIERLTKAEAAVVDTSPQVASDFVLKAIVIGRILNTTGDCDAECEKLCNQIIEFFGRGTA